MRTKTDHLGTVTFRTTDGYENVITIRREDVTTTNGAYRCIRDTIDDETHFVLVLLREFVQRAEEEDTAS